MFVWLLLPLITFSQSFHRIEADFSIKEVWSDSLSSLTMGKVYYDKHVRRIVYQVTFPEAGTRILEDSFYHVQSVDTLYSQASSPAVVDMSIFNLVLNGDLENFGLKDSLYFKSSVKKEQGLIVSTWNPHPKISHLVGDILISKKGKLLHAIIFLDVEEKVLSKQFYRKYDLKGALPFPQEVIQFIYRDGMEIQRVSTFRNIRFNSSNETGHYTTTIRE